METTTLYVPQGWRFVGIDPGVHGALAIIGPDGVYDVSDFSDSRSTGNRMAILNGIRSFKIFGAIEHPQPVPKQSAQSIQTLGIDIGIWRGIFIALDVKFANPRPQEWKREIFFGSGEKVLDKKASRRMAERLFPNASLGKRGDEGRSEALLIAEWMRRNYAKHFPV
jgi:hypothetical protein